MSALFPYDQPRTFGRARPYDLRVKAVDEVVQAAECCRLVGKKSRGQTGTLGTDQNLGFTLSKLDSISVATLRQTVTRSPETADCQNLTVNEQPRLSQASFSDEVLAKSNTGAGFFKVGIT